MLMYHFKDYGSELAEEPKLDTSTKIGSDHL